MLGLLGCFSWWSKNVGQSHSVRAVLLLGKIWQGNFTHFLVYANSSLAEQSIPAWHEIFATLQPNAGESRLLFGGALVQWLFHTVGVVEYVTM